MTPISRRTTVTVDVGGIAVGSGHPVVVQSMTNTDTADADATAIQVAQLAHAGSELVRITVNNDAAAQAVPVIREKLDRLGVDVPLIGDFHYNGHLLLTQYPAAAAALDRSRASEDEMAKITVAKAAVKEAKPAAGALEVEGSKGTWAAGDLANARAGSEKVYSPTLSRKNGKYVPDRTIDDTGYILFICANSDKHEDMEVIQKSCPACKGEDTFFWSDAGKGFVGFRCGEPYDNALVKCPTCGKAPRKVRTKHK